MAIKPLSNLLHLPLLLLPKPLHLLLTLLLPKLPLLPLKLLHLLPKLLLLQLKLPLLLLKLLHLQLLKPLLLKLQNNSQLKSQKAGYFAYPAFLVFRRPLYIVFCVVRRLPIFDGFRAFVFEAASTASGIPAKTAIFP